MFAPVGVAGESLKIAPPLTISEAALHESIAVFEESVDDVLRPYTILERSAKNTVVNTWWQETYTKKAQRKKILKMTVNPPPLLS